MNPSTRRDAQGRLPGQPGFDERTLRITQSEFHALTELEKQYWSIKRNHMDMIIFFKIRYAALTDTQWTAGSTIELIVMVACLSRSTVYHVYDDDAETTAKITSVRRC